MKIAELTLVDKSTVKPVFAGGGLCSVLKLSVPCAEGESTAAERFNGFYSELLSSYEEAAHRAAKEPRAFPVIVSVSWSLWDRGAGVIRILRRTSLRCGPHKLVHESCDAFDENSGIIIETKRKRKQKFTKINVLRKIRQIQ